MIAAATTGVQVSVAIPDAEDAFMLPVARFGRRIMEVRMLRGIKRRAESLPALPEAQR